MGRNKILFEEAKALFEESNCKLLHLKEDFFSIYKNSKTKLNYQASCGHNHNIQLRIFKYGGGKLCPNCIYKDRSVKLKKQQSGENKIINNKLESDAIIYLTSKLEEKFDIIKTFDTCKSDIIIKPKNDESDLWLGIQIKSTNNSNNPRNCYYFNLKKEYEDLLIISICYEDKKIWGFENDNIKHLKTTLQISKNKSKYNVFEITNTLIDFLSDKYKSLNKFNKEYLLNQLSKTTLVEYDYRNLRLNKIKFINFIENKNQSEVFDFKVGNKKIQEKVGKYICNKNNKIYGYFQFNLSKCNGKNHKKVPYQKGDNDVYWFNCKDTNKFYVIPEEILINYGFIEYKTSIIISNNNLNKLWLNDYKFDYEDLEKDKEKLCKILL
jgi:hypothetical protein